MPTAQAVQATPPCEVCHSTRVSLLRHSGRWDFDVVRCDECRMVFVAGQDAARAEIATRDDDPVDWDGYVSVLRGDAPLRQKVLRTLRGRFPADAAPVLFDVGAGTGEFLLQARIYCADAVSSSYVDGAVRLAEHRGLLDGGPDLATRRAELAHELHSWVRRVRVSQAHAAARFLELMRA